MVYFLKICIKSVNSCWSQPNSKLATKKNHHRKPLSRIYNASLQFIQNPHEGTLTMALHYKWADLISEGTLFYLHIHIQYLLFFCFLKYIYSLQIVTGYILGHREYIQLLWIRIWKCNGKTHNLFKGKLVDLVNVN